MNDKSQYPVFFKNHAAVTPELVVNRLRRINTHIWLFNKSYSQHKCQFVQKTFGNTGQQQDAIRISAQRVSLAVAKETLDDITDNDLLQDDVNAANSSIYQ